MESENYKRLTENEQDFCILLVEGGKQYAGNPKKCYVDTIGRDEKDIENDPFLGHYVNETLRRADIQGYISDLRKAIDDEANSEILRIYLKEKLLQIIEECSKATYTDRRGTKLSPAALRSVANHSIKTLMELTPSLRKDTEKDEDGENKQGGVTFNVIVPDKPEKTKEQIELEKSVNNVEQ